jgi:HTH-type transcriptional regulator/antitoxin HipB
VCILSIFPFGNIRADLFGNPAYVPVREYCFWRHDVKIRVTSASDIGAAVRRKRKDDGLTLVEASGLCNVNYRFLSNLENGKETVRLDKVLQVMAALGLELQITERTWPNA